MAFNWTHSDITALAVRERKHWATVSERRMGLKDGKAAETKKTTGNGRGA